MKVIGKVQKGRGKGKILGFPTANIKISEQFNLENGVYLAEVIFQDKKYKALAIRGVAKDLEVFILNFNKNLYSQKLTVAIGEKISEINQFKNQEQLIDKINSDILKAKKIWRIN